MLSAESIKYRFNALAPYLNEKVTRLWAGIEATTIARGGITLVSEATGLYKSFYQRHIALIFNLCNEFNYQPNR